MAHALSLLPKMVVAAERILQRLASVLRIYFLRLKGIRIGKHCYVGSGVTMHGNVCIGDGTVIGDMSILTTMPDGELIIGNDCYINSFNVLGAATRVSIGDHCLFAAFVQITDATHGKDDPGVLIKHAPITGSPVTIGKNVWFGSGAIVLQGVTIGDGAVVGAKALVNKSVPPRAIVVGIPAKLIGTR